MTFRRRWNPRGMFTSKNDGKRILKHNDKQKDIKC